VRTKANFLFFIRVCGRCMCYTRMGMLRDSYIFKTFGFVLFLHIFHKCFSALFLFAVGYCSFSFMYDFFQLILLAFSFLYGSFKALHWMLRYDGQNWLRFLFQISPGTLNTLTKKIFLHFLRANAMTEPYIMQRLLPSLSSPVHCILSFSNSTLYNFSH
jgi:hypothetical protein